MIALKEPMPIGTSLFGLITALAFLLPIAAVTVVSNAGKVPDTMDAFSVVGAMFATLIVLVESGLGTKTKSRLEFVAISIACSFVGSVGPGLVFSLMHWDKDILTWHAWAALGFLFGLGGWVLSHSSLWALNNYLPDFVEWAAKSRLGRKKPEDDPKFSLLDDFKKDLRTRNQRRK